ncbi:carboxymuconolactone decarboxylase family protein [Croceicoccus sp. YJ47]|uniref:carboxymuconolactone decarboxylase family protein n=1 Tax=Croceicoccus sp. YJ47 TaxID=2798724 RepID=UPI001920507A|nr:carboxymuconolactone decarboxylase family protein [Croceicoccus sp. YJ47]QQN74901.1 carboxymuconolactone decarboxylase family protein [Croceicoccus sp. YJ47]
MSDTYQIELSLRTPDDTDEAVSAPLKQAQKTMGMVPNMYAGMANLPALLATYSFGYDKFREDAGFSSVEQEVILLAVSRANECHYCVAAHSTLADTMSGVPAEVTDAIRSDQEIPEPKLRALAEFTRVMSETRGNPSPAQAKAFLEAGYSETHILGIILAISVKVISNYSNHLFHTEVDEAFAAREWSAPQ